MADTIEMVKPYLERALTDEEFRKDLKDALQAARELYGPLSKQNGVAAAPRALATDKKAQEQLRRAIDDLLSAKDNLKGKKQKSHKGRNMLLLAGLVAGALYNPWTGPQTREKLLDMIAGSDDLQPLDTFETPVADTAAAVEADGGRGCGGRPRRTATPTRSTSGVRPSRGPDPDGLDGLRRWSGPRRWRAPAAARRARARSRAEMSLASSSTAPARPTRPAPGARAARRY